MPANSGNTLRFNAIGRSNGRAQHRQIPIDSGSFAVNKRQPSRSPRLLYPSRSVARGAALFRPNCQDFRCGSPRPLDSRPANCCDRHVRRRQGYLGRPAVTSRSTCTARDAGRARGPLAPAPRLPPGPPSTAGRNSTRSLYQSLGRPTRLFTLVGRGWQMGIGDLCLQIQQGPQVLLHASLGLLQH